MQTTDARPLLSAADVADRLNLSRATVYRPSEASLIPGARRIGNQWRFNGEALEAWLYDDRDEG